MESTLFKIAYYAISMDDYDSDAAVKLLNVSLPDLITMLSIRKLWIFFRKVEAKVFSMVMDVTSMENTHFIGKIP